MSIIYKVIGIFFGMVALWSVKFAIVFVYFYGIDVYTLTITAGVFLISATIHNALRDRYRKIKGLED